MKVGLFGTTTPSTTWRDNLIPMLKCDYYNPVLDNWNDDLKPTDLDYEVYVVTPLLNTKPMFHHMVHYIHTRPETIIVCILDEDNGTTWEHVPDFEDINLKEAMQWFKNLAISYNVKVFESLQEISNFLNSKVLK